MLSRWYWNNTSFNFFWIHFCPCRWHILLKVLYFILCFSLKLVIVALCCVLGGVKSGSHLLSFRLASCGRGHCCETSLKVIRRNVHFILFHIKVKCFRLLDSEFGPTFFGNENPSFPHPPEKVLSYTQDLNIYFSTCVFWILNAFSRRKMILKIDRL